MTELRDRIAAHARPDLSTAVDGLTLSKVEYSEPDYSLTEPLLVVMAQGAKRLLLGDETFDYHAGDLFVVTTDLPVSGHFVDATPKTPALGMASRCARKRSRLCCSRLRQYAVPARRRALPTPRRAPSAQATLRSAPSAQPTRAGVVPARRRRSRPGPPAPRSSTPPSA